MGKAGFRPQPSERRSHGQQQPGGTGGKKGAAIEIKTHDDFPCKALQSLDDNCDIFWSMGNATDAAQGRFADEGLRRLRPALCLAQEMGKDLG